MTINPQLLKLGQSIRLKKDHVLTQQYAVATEFYLLQTGTVSFHLQVEDRLEDVGESRLKHTPIGWSGFNDPGRYATTVKVQSITASFIRWSHEDLKTFFMHDPEAYAAFMQECAMGARDLLKITSHLFLKQGPKVPVYQPQRPSVFVTQEHDQSFEKFVRKSAFFESLNEEVIDFISQKLQLRLYRVNEMLFSQGEQSDGLYILYSGKVGYHIYEGNQQVVFQHISTPGHLISWAGLVDQPNIMNAQASLETQILFISNEDLQRILKLHPEFVPDFYQRLLWLISYQLQAIRARIIANTYRQETLAIANLIEQNSVKLSLTSPLHKIPHLLENKETVSVALELLENCSRAEDSLEKSISSIALETLLETRKEQHFYQGLIKVFNTVVSAPKGKSASVVRKQCAEAYNQLFEKQQYVLTGEEHLPKEPGHIFIYNHLKNHPYNTLPNKFQITLDSHFLSSMVLYRKYGDPGMRIVRISGTAEYAHQAYYERLGYIDVYTPDSGPNTLKLKKEAGKKFFYEGAQTLLRGQNLIISPEGNSFSTQESPGHFKPGAFKLALSMKKEPLIVPVAFAYFDHRARNNTFSCKIMPAFKVSDYISDPNDKEAFSRFLEEYQEQYKSYVEEAINQSENAWL